MGAGSRKTKTVARNLPSAERMLAVRGAVLAHNFDELWASALN